MNRKESKLYHMDEYFMGVASLSAMRSKDPNTQVGACIVSNDNKILSMGYNGFPQAAPTTSSRGAKGIRIPTTINIST